MRQNNSNLIWDKGLLKVLQGEPLNIFRENPKDLTKSQLSKQRQDLKGVDQNIYLCVVGGKLRKFYKQNFYCDFLTQLPHGPFVTQYKKCSCDIRKIPQFSLYCLNNKCQSAGHVYEHLQSQQRQRQLELCEFQVILIYIVSSAPARATKENPDSNKLMIDDR